MESDFEQTMRLFAADVFSALDEKQTTMRQLSKDMGICETQISRTLKGLREKNINFTVEKLVRLARALDKTLVIKLVEAS